MSDSWVGCLSKTSQEGIGAAMCDERTKEKNLKDKSPSICTFLARRKYGERLIY